MSIDRLEVEVATDEGWRAKPYQDTVGVWTVGYGFNLEDRAMPEAVGRYWMRLDRRLGRIEEKLDRALGLSAGFTP
jgi:GH24 family phage-related lysozyme (muramidase)